MVFTVWADGHLRDPLNQVWTGPRREGECQTQLCQMDRDPGTGGTGGVRQMAYAPKR